MTERDFLNAVATNAVTEEAIEYAKSAIGKYEKRLESRKGNSKTAKANAPIKDDIVAFLNDNGGGKTAAEIANATGQTVQKVTVLCTQLRKEGRVTAVEVKKPEGKGKCLAYTATTA